jgi:tryptophan-rich sensory protein
MLGKEECIVDTPESPTQTPHAAPNDSGHQPALAGPEAETPVAKKRSAWAAVGFAAATVTAAGIGSLTSRPGPWYRSLRKSKATPPSAVFGPVWTVLYATMAYSAWRVWRAPASHERSRALKLWAAQLGLNAAWSPTFFAAKSPRASLAIIVALLPTLELYLRTAWKVDRLAMAVMYPYLPWTAFAAYLNAQIVKKNRFRL